ncbi:TrfB-related DNA-binding protein, partial [Pseudomonas syringae group genomosp. 3]
FSEKSIQAARLILVMGASMAEAAADVGLARQVVHRLMKRIRARLQMLPGEWVKVEAWLPPAVAKQVADLAMELAHQARQGCTALSTS